MESTWTVCLDGAKRIERDREVVAWLYERKWEQLLVALASAEGTPVFRRQLVTEMWDDRPNGGQRLAEVCFELKANLQEMGAPEDAVISDRHAIRLAPSITVQAMAPVRVGHVAPAVDRTETQPPVTAPTGPIEEFIETLPRRHAERCLALVDIAEPHLLGPRRQEWMTRLDAEHDGIVAALDWAIEGDHGRLALGIAGAMWRYWHARAKAGLGRTYVDRVLFVRDDRSGTALEAKCLNGAGALAALDGDLDIAEKRLDEALAIWRGIGDRVGEARALVSLGIVALRRKDYVTGRQLYKDALEIGRDEREPDLVLVALRDQALVEKDSGNLADAEALLRERLALCVDFGDDVRRARTLVDLATIVQMRGDISSAFRLAEQALRTFDQASDLNGLAFAALVLGCASHTAGDLKRAELLYDGSLAAAQSAGNMRRVGEALRYQAALAEDLGERDQSIARYQQAHDLLRSAGDARGASIVEAALGEMGVGLATTDEEGREP